MTALLNELTDGSTFTVSEAPAAVDARLLPPIPAPGETLTVYSLVDMDRRFNDPDWVRDRGRSWVERTKTEYKVKRAADGTLRFYRTVSEMTRGYARPNRHRPLLLGVDFDAPETPVGPTQVAERAKTFCRWQTTEVTIVEPRPSGEWLIKTLSRGKRRVHWTSHLAFGPEPTDVERVASIGYYSHVFRSAINQSFADVVVNYVGEPAPLGSPMPLMVHYLDTIRARDSHRQQRSNMLHGQYATIGTAEFRRCFRGAHTAADLTLNLFGKKQYRRDLVKAVAQADLHSLVWAWSFRGLVPIDWIVTFLRNRAAGRAEEIERAQRGRAVFVPPQHNLRPYLRNLDQRSLKRLLNETHPRHANLIRDLGRMPVNPHLRRVEDWENLHDLTSDYMRRLRKDGKPRKPRTITLPDEAAALTGWIPPTEGGVRGLRVEIASSERQMWEWGDEMHHCIASYCDAMRGGYGWYGGVYELAPRGATDSDGKPIRERLIGNFEVRLDRIYPQTTDEYGHAMLDHAAAPTITARLTQFLGKRNQTLPADVRRTVEQHLAAHGIDVSKYWGNGERIAA